MDFRIWEFNNDDDSVGETVVSPIKKTPVKSLSGRFVGTTVELQNGSEIWALIGNLDPNNERLTKHFLTLSVFRDGKWFSLARYHDFDFSKRGPEAIARFLNLSIKEVFPIKYDVSKWVVGHERALVGAIDELPLEKLTRAQIIGLAVP